MKPPPTVIRAAQCYGTRADVPVVSVNTGATDSPILDWASGFFGDANKEVEHACDMLKDHPDLKASEGINMVGFSQGGQFARAVVQRCRYGASDRGCTPRLLYVNPCVLLVVDGWRCYRLNKSSLARNLLQGALVVLSAQERDGLNQVITACR